MIDYSRGKIYRIRGGNESYIGSTTNQYLSNRMAVHRKVYRYMKDGKDVPRCSSFVLFDKYGVENCHIELIEVYPCSSVEELHKKEGEWIRKEECVNRVISGQTAKEWREKNRDHCNTVQRPHSKKYREKNKEELKKKASVKIKCDCGSEFRIADKARHLRSKKHNLYKP